MAQAPLAEPQVATRLPENAYRELKPGETYVPMVPPRVHVPEVTTRSIVFGIVMNILFSMAATYLALKVGQGIETAIPISVLAVGLSGVLLGIGRRRSSILENVNILAISTTSGIVAGGTVFTMPAIYILRLHEHLGMSPAFLFLQIFLVPFLGAILGVLFLIPFRRYFVKEMHGKLRFPEGTATNEILVSGSAGGIAQAAALVYAFVVGFGYNLVSAVLKLFTETFTTEAVPALERLTTHQKAVFSLGTGAEFLGLGFIIGVRYAAIICAGSFLSWFVLIPLLSPLNNDQLRVINPLTGSHDGPVEAAPQFTLPSDLRARLAEFDALDAPPPAAIQPGAPATAAATRSPEERREFIAGLRRQLVAAFANNKVEIYDKERLAISTEKPGVKWKVKDDRQTYILEARDTGAVAVLRRTSSAENIFRGIPRNIGIGCIFAAGLLSILKMSRVIVTALTQALGSLFRRSSAASADRTDTDISYPTMMLVGVLTAAAIFLYFRFVVMASLPNATQLALISLGLALVVAFIFTTVSAWAIATISVTPISGMTVTTLIVTAVVLVAAGLPTGKQSPEAGYLGMLIVLLVGGVVASCLSMAGTLITEMKISYWVGASPKKVQWSAILASLLASAVVTATIMVLAKAPGYDPDLSREALRAPQANLMASALSSFLGTGDVPWLMYAVGVVIALIMQLLGISPLAFGLGMYLPMELNTPILIGAVTAWAVNRSTRNEARQKARNDKGVLLASGLIAGAAILGVCRSIVNIVNPDLLKRLDLSGRLGPEAESLGNWIGLAAFIGLCIFVYLNCLTARLPREEPGATEPPR